eukprot:4565784-Amphidinium_carterae.1
MPRLRRDRADYVIRRCCKMLDLDQRGARYSLVHGNDVVPAMAEVQDWPGIRPLGEVSEYQLVVQRAQHP